MADGKGYRREPGSPKLARELRDILDNPSPNLLIGIPTMDRDGPKVENWLKHRARFADMLLQHRTFHSAFISRPDSAPWINTRKYAELVQSLWAGKHVAILAEPDNSIIPLIEKTAARVSPTWCPSKEAYRLIDHFEDVLLDRRADIIIMSCGPTATCLANRLAFAGQHAVDIGSAGGFLSKLLK